MTDEQYKLYDEIVSETVKRIWDIAKEHKEIIIENPEAVSPYMWQMLFFFQTFYEVPLYIHAGVLKTLELRRLHRNVKFKPYWFASKICTLDPVALLDKMSMDMNLDTQIFDDIYKAYYGKDKND